jgi:hypothetical protein
MKTTIDFPEEILHRAKIVAAQRKTTLRELLITGLTHTLNNPPKDEDFRRRERASRLIAALGKGRNADSIGPLNRDELHDRHQLF